MSDLQAVLRDEIDAFRPGAAPSFDELVSRRRVRQRHRGGAAAAAVAASVLAISFGWQSLPSSGPLDQAGAPSTPTVSAFTAHSVLDAAPAELATGTVAAPAAPDKPFPTAYTCPAATGERRAWPAGLVACTAPGQPPEILRLSPPGLTGDSIAAATVSRSPADGFWSVDLRLTLKGRQDHAALAAQAACAPAGSPERRIALAVDGVVYATETFDASVPCDGKGLDAASLLLTVPGENSDDAARFARALTAEDRASPAGDQAGTARELLESWPWGVPFAVPTELPDGYSLAFAPGVYVPPRGRSGVEVCTLAVGADPVGSCVPTNQTDEPWFSTTTSDGRWQVIVRLNSQPLRPQDLEAWRQLTYTTDLHSARWIDAPSATD